jgi:hypothetical protein
MQSSVGAITVTLKEQVLELPQRSVAVQPTGLAPTGNNDPLGGMQLTCTGPG